MNDIRSTESVVTFRQSFFLESLGVEQPAGSYRLVVDEMAIDGLSFLAYRRVATMLHLPAIGTSATKQQVYEIDPDELALAREKDQHVTPNAKMERSGAL